MNSKLEALFNQPEKAYLQPNELNMLSQFVSSLPDRINFYRRLRSEELTLMQSIANVLEQKFPQQPEETLKRSLQNAILMVRYAAMSMLTDDADFVSKRLETWLPDMIEAYDTLEVDQMLYQIIREHFSERFTAQQMTLLSPSLDSAQKLLSSQLPAADDSVIGETLVSLF
jgi:hypothetical protein